MKNSGISRKDFLRNSVLGVAGLTFGSGILNSLNAASPEAEPDLKGISGNFTLKNVRLETGFEYKDGEVDQTKTELFMVQISDGKIKSISANKLNEKAIDAKGLLMLPAFRDMHIHLDKTYYGDQWRAVKKRTGGIKGMIALEQEIIPELLKNSTYKAERMIELLQSKGTSFARSHVNIEPTSKLQSLKNLQVALENKKTGFDAELVAFPQHGVFYTDSVPYLKEAAQMDIDFIGGVDPLR